MTLCHEMDGAWSLDALKSGEVHVGIADVRRIVPHLQQCRGVLSEEELCRAAQFHSSLHAERFLVRRWMVRSVLSGYTGEPPDRLTFVKGAFGKPSLAANGCGEKIEFNVSHSENLMVVAVSSIGCVGIDVEYLGGNAAWERVVPSAFTEREIAAVSSLPLPEQSAGYYQCWVLKEAYVKATGLGLTLPLRDVEVYMYCTEGRLRFSLAAAGAWWSQEVDVADDYVCALVVDGSPRRVRCGLVPDHEWPGTKMCSVQPGSAIHPA